MRGKIWKALLKLESSLPLTPFDITLGDVPAEMPGVECGWTSSTSETAGSP